MRNKGTAVMNTTAGHNSVSRFHVNRNTDWEGAIFRNNTMSSTSDVTLDEATRLNGT